jgi:thiol-disulfide isomerase/thioredoxin
MKRIDSTWIFGGLVALAMGMALVIVPMTARQPPAQGGEFPPEWFAPGTENERQAHEGLVGKPMPPLHLSGWRNGELSPTDLKGKVILIDFWATWCAPCIAAFPDNSALYAKYKPRGLEAIGVCTNIMQENYDKILNEKKPTYPMARDPESKTADAWSAKSYPTYAMIDRKGNLRAIGLKHEYVERVIQSLLDEPE